MAATTRGSVITASTRSGAPQRERWPVSMSNTRRIRCAQRSSGREWAPARARLRRSPVQASAWARRGGDDVHCPAVDEVADREEDHVHAEAAHHVAHHELAPGSAARRCAGRSSGSSADSGGTRTGSRAPGSGTAPRAPRGSRARRGAGDTRRRCSAPGRRSARAASATRGSDRQTSLTTIPDCGHMKISWPHWWMNLACICP